MKNSNINNFIPEAMASYYKHVREVMRSLYPKFLSAFDKEAVERCAKRLDIFQNNSLMLNTEHEMNLFYDYCLYNHRKEGLNAIQRSFNNFSDHYVDEELELFEAAKNGYFAYLEIVKPVDDTGLVVYDRVRKKEHLMLDNGLNKAAHSTHKYAIVSHIMILSGDYQFTITTGASTPVQLDTAPGNKVQQRFEKYLSLVSTCEPEYKDTAQYITDMYKICLHEDITMQVASPTVPFGEEALKQRVMASDTEH